ncbi:MAG: gliding motility lipoprotein GldH [Bacteroidales bacterium]|nr:MAG: gliding motility lipoprotein GldH [Bacteroidales bacterium]
MKKNLIFKPSCFLILVLLTSCDPNRVFEENKTIPDHTWKWDNVLNFNVEIADTVNPHNIFVNIRNGGQYQYSNLYLFIKTISPSGQWIRDTVECILADEKGRWLGNGLGDIYEIRIPYKINVRFPYTGIYTFEFEQAMRIEDLNHIFDVGLRVERVK